MCTAETSASCLPLSHRLLDMAAAVRCTLPALRYRSSCRPTSTAAFAGGRLCPSWRPQVCRTGDTRRAAASLQEHDGQNVGAVPIRHHGSVVQRPTWHQLLWLPRDNSVGQTTWPHKFADCNAPGIGVVELLRELRDFGVALVGGCPSPDDEQGQLLQQLGEWLGGPPMEHPSVSVRGNQGSTDAGAALPGLWHGAELCTEDAFLREPAAVLAVLPAAGSVAPKLRLVDGFAAAKALQATSPEAFSFLASRPLPWRRGSDVGSPSQPVLVAPMLRLHLDGALETLRWNLADLDVQLGLATRSEAETHAAALAALLASGRFEQQVQLRPGELVLLDNRRVLHGVDGVGSSLTLVRFGRDQVERALRLRGLLPPLGDAGITSSKVRVVRSPTLGYMAVAAASVDENERLFALDLTVPDGRMKEEPSINSIQVSEYQHVLPTLVPDELGGLIRYPSHMRNPSLKVRVSPGLLEMVARRPLEAGEELAFNYCSTEWSMASPFVCARTKAEIRGFRHLPLEERRRLLSEDLVAPHLQRLAALQG